MGGGLSRLAIAWMLVGCETGARSDLYRGPSEPQVAFAETDAALEAFAELDGDPDGKILEGSYCIGFGLGPPVVDHPRPALPLFCGRDCANGLACPQGHRCWAVYRPAMVDGAWAPSTDVVAYQCFPQDGVCPGGIAAGEHCGPCDDDAQCARR